MPRWCGNTVRGFRPQRCGLALGAFIVLCSSTPAAPAQVIPCRFEVQTFLGPDCGLDYAHVTMRGLNDSTLPTVVGSWFCPPGDDHAFYWNESVGFVTLAQPPQGVYSTSATDMNNVIGKSGLGQIAGTLESTSLGIRGFLWTEGAWTVIPLIPGATQGFASAISESSNYVVGRSGNNVTNDPPYTAYRWKPGELTVLSVPYGPYSAATDVSADGSTIVGTMGPANAHHAFIWTNGVITDLGTIPGGYTASPTAINSLGQILIVGRVPDPGGPPPGTFFAALFGRMGDGLRIRRCQATTPSVAMP